MTNASVIRSGAGILIAVVAGRMLRALVVILAIIEGLATILSGSIVSILVAPGVAARRPFVGTARAIIGVIPACARFPRTIYCLTVETRSARTWRPLFPMPAGGLIARRWISIISPLLIEISSHVSFPNGLGGGVLLRGGRIGKILNVYPVD